LTSSINLIQQTKDKVYAQFKRDIIDNNNQSIDLGKLHVICHSVTEGERAVDYQETLRISGSLSSEEIQARERNNMLAVTHDELLEKLSHVGLHRPKWCADGPGLFNSKLSHCLGAIIGEQIEKEDQTTIKLLELRMEYNDKMVSSGSGRKFMAKKAMEQYAEKLDGTILILENRETTVKSLTLKMKSAMNSKLGADEEDEIHSGNVRESDVQELSKNQTLLEVISTVRNKLTYTLRSLRKGARNQL
jgi:hypothetical protein